MDVYTPPGDMPGICIAHQNTEFVKGHKAAIIVHRAVLPDAPSDFSVYFRSLFDPLNDRWWVLSTDNYSVPMEQWDVFGDRRPIDGWAECEIDASAIVTKPGFLRYYAPYVADDGDRLFAFRKNGLTPRELLERAKGCAQDPLVFGLLDAVFINWDGLYWYVFTPREEILTLVRSEAGKIPIVTLADTTLLGAMTGLWFY